MRFSFSPHLGLAVVTILFCSTSLQAQVSGQQVKAILSNAATTQGRFRVTWLQDGTMMEAKRLSNGVAVYRVNPENGDSTPLLPADVKKALLTQYSRLTGTTTPEFPFRSLSWARNGHLMLFRDASAREYLFDLDKRRLRALKRPKLQVSADEDALMRNMQGSQLLNGTFSPDYSQIAYVRGYDLYVMNTRTGAETRLTAGGSDSLMNGRPDWAYPEELDQTEAFFWSPDGHKIAYLQFDERPVTPYPILHDLKAPAHVESERYPVAGANNPIVKLFVVDLRTHRTVQIATKSSGNVYVIRPNWTPDGSEILFQRLDRHQDTLQLLAGNPKTGAVRTVITEHDPAYITLNFGDQGFGRTPGPMLFLKDGKRFLWPSERTGWRQWYLYSLSGKELAQITNGERAFRYPLAIDEAQGVMYATAATAEGQEEQLFRARLDGSGVTQMTDSGGVHFITMDSAARYYLDVFSSPTHPPTAELRTTAGKTLRQIGAVTYNFQGLRVHGPEEVTVKAADGVTNLHGLLYKPVGYDSTKKYPLLVEVYGGPDVQQVQRTDEIVDQYQIAAQDGYMVWVVDNRGTPNRGRAFERATYLKLGQVDLDDQAAAVRELIKTHRYIDSTRVGITGASYGGYMSALALLRYPDVFQVGVAESAVTDWRNYDSIYTERYMRTPSENTDGYDKASTLNKASQLSGHLLIMHGTTDNNVHISNAMQLIQSLLSAGKHFDLMIFPEERHGVNGDQVQQEFLDKYLLH